MDISQFKQLVSYIRGNKCPVCKLGKLKPICIENDGVLNIKIKCSECDVIYDRFVELEED